MRSAMRLAMSPSLSEPTTTLARLAVDIGWSLWTELGVPGVLRNHSHVAIDPEPLVVFSPWLFHDDARLQEEIVRWCVAHADRISGSRLHGLLKAVPADVASAFAPVSTTLHAHGVPWAEAGGHPVSLRADASPKPLPTTRPSLVRFRLRALVGVGARADVLGELLGKDDAWMVASDLQGLGYSKRNTARILAELADAGLIKVRPERNASAYQVQGAALLLQLIHGDDLAWPDWLTVFELIGDVRRLSALSAKSEAVRRVAAVKAAATFEAASDVLGCARPPSGAGMPDAWQSTIAWAETLLGSLAAGTSAALTPRARPASASRSRAAASTKKSARRP